MAHHDRRAGVPGHAARPRPRPGEPLGTHLPGPVASRAARADPCREALLSDSVGLALLVVLGTVTPAERLAFVLHDMFDLPFDEIGPIVERSPAAARQLASRARRQAIPQVTAGHRIRIRARGSAAAVFVAA